MLAQTVQRLGLSVCLAGMATGEPAAVDSAEVSDRAAASRSAIAHEVTIDASRQVYITSLGEMFEDETPPTVPGAQRGGECQLVNGYASEEFSGGTYFVQAGFVENEIAAASYELSPGLFPIRIDLIEALIGTAGTNVPTTTAYTILVWDGRPDTGTLVASFSSDGAILPDIQIPAGPPQAVNVNFLIDPGDPQQIFVNNTSGQNTFTIGIRIDEHNNQTGTGCFPAPPETSNAFPMTDTDGADQTGNWINAINCGPFGCPPGWSTFQQFPALCTPSGDWMLRATWTSFTCSDQTGACCDGMGSCFDLTQAECDAINGSFEGAGTQCAGFTCPIPEGACCLSNGNCLLQTEANCDLIGGEWQGADSECNGSLCPIGAACLPDGSCIDGVTELEAQMLSGTFLGVGTECAGTDCPQPRGACCITTTENCLQLTEDDCGLIPFTVWQGAGSICDSDGDGQPDGMCIAPEPCPADTNSDGQLTPGDFNGWVLAFNNQAPGCDQNGDSLCNPNDFNAWILNYNAGCP
ncbi:MAG: GC-type dockerin domain-anchored protein [Planctomycetota bacterium]